MRVRVNRFIVINVEDAMKNRWRKFRRGWGTFYAYDNQTGNSRSLKTRDKHHAQRLVNAMNEAEREVGIRKQVGLREIVNSIHAGDSILAGARFS